MRSLLLSSHTPSQRQHSLCTTQRCSWWECSLWFPCKMRWVWEGAGGPSAVPSWPGMQCLQSMCNVQPQKLSVGYHLHRFVIDEREGQTWEGVWKWRAPDQSIEALQETCAILKNQSHSLTIPQHLRQACYHPDEKNATVLFWSFSNWFQWREVIAQCLRVPKNPSSPAYRILQ